MSLFAISGLINTIAVAILGGIVYFKNRTKEINIRYALFCFFVAFWSFSYFLWQMSQDKSSALFWSRCLMAGAIFIPVCFFHFVLLLLNVYEQKKRIISIGYLIFLLFFILDVTPWFVSDVTPKMFFKFWPEPGPIFTIFLLIWFWYCLYPCYLLIRDYRKFSGIKRQQIKYVLIGILIGYGSGSTNYFLWYNIPIPPYGNFIVPLFVGMMAYAVVRYRLMDITILAVRTIIFLVVYGVLLVMPLVTFFASKPMLTKILAASKWWILPFAVGIYALLASSAPFIYLYFQRRAENILLKDQRRYQRAMLDLSKTLGRIRDLDNLLRAIVITVVDKVNVAFAGIYLTEDEYKSYQLKHCLPKKERSRFQEFIPKDYSLIKFLNQQKKPLLSEEVGYLDKIRLDSGLVIPCFIEDTLLGFLVLGPKPNNQMYTPDDVLIFETLSYSTALAIENCTYWKEIEDRQRKARIQEMDTYSYSLGHEINNPMQTVFGLSKILKDEILKDMPEGEKRKDIENSFDLIIEGSRRVFGMVKAIRDFGSPVTGEAKPLRIDEVVESSIQLFLPQLKEKAIAFEKLMPEVNHPVYVRGEKPELMQVLINFANNAMHALIDAPVKKITLKMEYPNPDWVRISFSDTGYGIRKERIEAIFAAFVTSKASTEGTGMGLYYAKKVIDKYKGKIWAESEGPGKGATFFVELPTAKDVKKEELTQDDFKKKRLF